MPLLGSFLTSHHKLFKVSFLLNLNEIFLKKINFQITAITNDTEGFETIVDEESGNHILSIGNVSFHHETSYRCIVSQGENFTKQYGGNDSPIYGYHFVKVHKVPKCQILGIDNARSEVILGDSAIDIKCSDFTITDGIVAILSKDGERCSMSNQTETKSYCVI